MPRVLNKETGMTHDVPVNHFSLADPLYDVLPERVPAVEIVLEPEAPTKARAPKARVRKE